MKHQTLLLVNLFIGLALFGCGASNTEAPPATAAAGETTVGSSAPTPPQASNENESEPATSTPPTVQATTPKTTPPQDARRADVANQAPKKKRSTQIREAREAELKRKKAEREKRDAPFKKALAPAVKPPECRKLECRGEPYFDDGKCEVPPANPPNVEIEALLPLGKKNHWAVIFEATCQSPCFEGGDYYVSLVRKTGNQKLRVTDTKALKKQAPDDYPGLVETTEARDYDDDGKDDILVQYLNYVDSTDHCNSMYDRYEYLILFEADSGKLTKTWESQVADLPYEMDRNYHTDIALRDDNGDGPDDLVLTTHHSIEWDCRVDPRDCDFSSTEGAYTVMAVHLFDPEEDGWRRNGYKGYVHGGERSKPADCVVPLPEKPFVVIAGSFYAGEINEEMERKAEALREAGFKHTCLYNGDDYEKIADDVFAVIVSSHDTVDAARGVAKRVTDAGFKCYVKRAFEK